MTFNSQSTNQWARMGGTAPLPPLNMAPPTSGPADQEAAPAEGPAAAAAAEAQASDPTETRADL